MNNEPKIGENWMRRRTTQRIIFIAVAGSIGGGIGGYFGLNLRSDPSATVSGLFEAIPLWLVASISLIFIGLFIYNWIRFDEFERPRYDRSSSFGLFAGMLIFPWYIAGTQGVLPPPHPLACLFLIFGAKWLVYGILKYKS